MLSPFQSKLFTSSSSTPSFKRNDLLSCCNPGPVPNGNSPAAFAGLFTVYFYCSGREEIFGQLSLDVEIHRLANGQLMGLDRANGQLQDINRSLVAAVVGAGVG